jgi:ribA/ribD-fused uncharacterized protein
MYPLRVPILTDAGIKVPTSEHAYMANRFKNQETQIRVALARGEDADQRVFKDGLAAKDLAHQLIEAGEPQVDEFEFRRVDIMYSAVRQKFVANHDIAVDLIATADEPIIEGNTWGDRFWGADPPGSTNGENNLGKILMRVRSELADQ